MAENLGSVYTEFRLMLDGLKADTREATATLRSAHLQMQREQQAAMKKMANENKRLTKDYRTVGTAATTTGATMAAGLAVAVTAAAEAQSAVGKFGAQTGTSGKALDGFGKSIKNVYAAGFGADMMEVSDTMAIVKREFNANSKEAEGLTKNALTLSKVFGYDVVDSSKAAGMMTKQFGVSGQDAYDIITKSSQLAGDRAGDLLDTFDEYGVQFANMGFSATEFSGLMVKGLKDGSFNADKLGDSFKEFGQRVTDGSKSSNTALVELLGSQGAVDKLMKDMGSGALTTKDAMQLLNGKLAEVPDKVKQNQIGVALWGTMWEDLGGKAVMGLANSDAALQGYKGSTSQAMQQTMGLGQSLTSAWRSAQMALVPFGEALAPVVKYIADMLQKVAQLTRSFAEAHPVMATVVAAVTAIGAAFMLIMGPILLLIGTALPGLITLFTFLSTTVIPMLTGVVAPFIGAFMVVAGLAALIYAAWKTNFGGFADFVSNVWNLVIAKFNEVKAFVMPIITELVSYITERWKTIQPVVSTVMNAIGAVVSFILPMIYSTIQFYLNAAMNVFKGVFNIIAGVIKFFVALFTGDWKGMWDAVKQVLTGAVQAIWGLFQLWFVGRIAGVIGSFVGKGLGFLTGFASKAISAITGFVSRAASGFASFVSRGVSAFTGFASRAGAAVTGFVTRAVQGFLNFASRAASAIGNFVSRAISGIGNFASRAISAIGNFVSRAIQGFTNFASRAASAISNFASRAVSAIGNFASRAVSAITNFVSRAIQGFTNFASRAVSAISSMASRVLSAISRMMSSLVSAINSGISRALSSFARFAAAIPRAFSSVVGRMASIGKNIVQGIWKGISGMGGWLKSKITSFAKASIPGPVAKALGIHSPSRVMAQQIGKWIPAGIAMGAEDNAKPITNMAKTLAKQATTQLQSKVGAAQVAATLNANPTVTSEQRVVQGTGVTEQYTFNGPLIGQAVVRSAQDAKQVSQNLYARIANKGRAQGSIVLG